MPQDVLRSILQRLFPLGRPEPLQEMARRWFALHSVSHSWAAVLEAEPPIQVCWPDPAPPTHPLDHWTAAFEPWTAGMQGRDPQRRQPAQAHAAVLHVTCSRSSNVEWDELQDAESFYWRLATGEALPVGQPEPANDAPMLDLSACRQLKVSWRHAHVTGKRLHAEHWGHMACMSCLLQRHAHTTAWLYALAVAGAEHHVHGLWHGQSPALL